MAFCDPFKSFASRRASSRKLRLWWRQALKNVLRGQRWRCLLSTRNTLYVQILTIELWLFVPLLVLAKTHLGGDGPNRRSERCRTSSHGTLLKLGALCLVQCVFLRGSCWKRTSHYSFTYIMLCVPVQGKLPTFSRFRSGQARKVEDLLIDARLYVEIPPLVGQDVVTLHCHYTVR